MQALCGEPSSQFFDVLAARCRVASDLYRVLDKCEVGDVIDVEVLRENAKEHLSVTLEASTN